MSRLFKAREQHPPISTNDSSHALLESLDAKVRLPAQLPVFPWLRPLCQRRSKCDGHLHERVSVANSTSWNPTPGDCVTWPMTKIANVVCPSHRSVGCQLVANHLLVDTRCDLVTHITMVIPVPHKAVVEVSRG